MSNNNHAPVKGKIIDLPARVEQPNQVKITDAQYKQILKLSAAIDQAQVASEAAQKALQTANQNANDFLIYCAEELGVGPLNEWQFDAGTRSFQRVLTAVNLEGNHANLSGTE